jgi:hypothetical protein
MSRKMLFALAGVVVLLAGAHAWKADAAMPIGVSSLPPLVHSSSPVETARCVCGPRGCACGRAWRRGYWGSGPGWRRAHWGWGPGWQQGYWGPAWGARRCWWRGGVRVCRW